MANTLKSILTKWYENRRKTQWVLGTIYKTEGHCYRKTGAMMLINGYGEQYGLLSGGCLEADIKMQAKKVMHSGKSMTLSYDATDEDDLSYQMEIGCGGKVYIMLQPLTSDADLGLSAMLSHLEKRESGLFYQKLPCLTGTTEAYFSPSTPALEVTSHLEEREDGPWLVTPIHPEPHLLIIGGGLDAIPLSRLAKNIGWQVSLCDPRPAQGRVENFPDVDVFLDRMGTSLEDYARESKVQACMVMSHNVTIDGRALADLRYVPICYLGLLGPTHRREEVLQKAQISEKDLPCPLSGPAGLDIGGDLPENIALSILAECHARLHQKSGVLSAQMVA